MTKPTGKPRGPVPIPYNPEIGAMILAGLASGDSLLKMQKQHPEWPTRDVLTRWEDEVPEYGRAVWVARARGASALVDKMDEVIENSTPETASADNVKIRGYGWIASRINPRRFGDKVALVGGDEGDSPIKNEMVVKFVRG